jgi:hypothetical protein
MDIDQLLNRSDYIKIPLVGNKYTGNKITQQDTSIILNYDTSNKYDKNAIKVISIKNNREYELGYIIKDKTNFIRKNINKLCFKIIIKRRELDKNYYYLIYQKLN